MLHYYTFILYIIELITFYTLYLWWKSILYIRFVKLNFASHFFRICTIFMHLRQIIPSTLSPFHINLIFATFLIVIHIQITFINLMKIYQKGVYCIEFKKTRCKVQFHKIDIQYWLLTEDKWGKTQFTLCYVW